MSIRIISDNTQSTLYLNGRLKLFRHVGRQCYVNTLRLIRGCNIVHRIDILLINCLAKLKMKYRLTCKVSRYCFLTLYERTPHYHRRDDLKSSLLSDDRAMKALILMRSVGPKTPENVPRHPWGFVKYQ